MKINRKLNLVMEVESNDGAHVHIHSTPISSVVFDLHYDVIGMTFNKMYAGGFGLAAGPRIADKLLRDQAIALGKWDGQGGVQQTLIAEIHRLTNVLKPGVRGWEMIPYPDAKAELDPDDCAEIEAALVFFTVTSTMHKRSEAPKILEAVLPMWGGQTTSLDCTAYMNSLRTLKEEEPSVKTDIPQVVQQEPSSQTHLNGVPQTQGGKPRSAIPRISLGTVPTNTVTEQSSQH